MCCMYLSCKFQYKRNKIAYGVSSSRAENIMGMIELDDNGYTNFGHCGPRSILALRSNISTLLLFADR